MRIFNKMKKTMLVLAASLFCANGAFAEIVVLYSNNFNSGGPIGGWGNSSTREVVDGVMKITNPSAVNPWDAQTAYNFDSPLLQNVKYTLKLRVKGSAEGSISANLRNASTYAGAGDFGAISFTTEWKEVVLTTVCTANDANSFIFNHGNFMGDIFMDDIELSYDGLIAPKNWVSVMANNFEGTEATEFVVKENGGDAAGNFVTPAIAEGIGKDSKGIKVTSFAGATQPWDAQFWIAPSEPFVVGFEYRVAFDYCASAAVTVGTQAHDKPGEYKHNDAIGQVAFTTEWKHFEKTVIVSKEYGSIAFNLSENKEKDIEFFLDNVTVEMSRGLSVIDGRDFNGTGYYTSAIYEREFNTDYTYGTICLPFAPDAATLENYTFYAISEPADNALTFVEETAPKAYVPYLYSAKDKEATTHTFTGGETVIESEPDCGVYDYAPWCFFGALTEEYYPVEELPGEYFAYQPTAEGEDVIVHASKNITIKPYRAYFMYMNQVGGFEPLATMRIVVRGAGDLGDGTTAIEEVITPDQIEGAAPAIYNLMGQPVAQPVKGQIYIINGKKVVY